MRYFAAAVASVLAVACASCGGSGSCVPGRQVECACGDGDTGFQVCLDDGYGWTDCMCDCQEDSDCPDGWFCNNGSCEEEGSLAEISVNLNLRCICNYGIVPAQFEETRCDNDTECPGEEFCWMPDPVGSFVYEKGFCRECRDDSDCGTGLQCDYHFCHKPCSSDSDCSGQGFSFCTGGFCRPPHEEFLLFSIASSGIDDLIVYINQTELLGANDACAFSHYEWFPPTDDKHVVVPDDTIDMNVFFTPEEPGRHIGVFEIYSNDMDEEVLKLFLCGYALEAPCDEEIDGHCPHCPCTMSEFESILDQRPTPNCGG